MPYAQDRSSRDADQGEGARRIFRSAFPTASLRCCLPTGKDGSIVLRSRVLVCAALAATIAGGQGCIIGGRNQLIGFPRIDAANPSDHADRAQEIVRNTEQDLRQSKNPVLEG